MRHQLVSEYTDYLIVLERAAGEEADGLPTLQKTPQMLAAGWGGTGTVMARCDDYSFGFDDFEPSGLDAEPVALFSRRSNDISPLDAVAGGRAGPVFPGESLRQTIAELGEPLAQPERALLEYIAHQHSVDPAFGVPITIDALVAVGLPDELAKALRTLVAAGHSESDIVWAYLLLIARDATPDSNATVLLVPLAARTIPAKLLATVEEVIVEARGTAGALRQIRKNARRLFLDEPGKWLKRIRD